MSTGIRPLLILYYLISMLHSHHTNYGHVPLWFAHWEFLPLRSFFALFPAWLIPVQSLRGGLSITSSWKPSMTPPVSTMRQIPTSVPSENRLLTSFTLCQSHIIPRDLEDRVSSSMFPVSRIFPGSEQLTKFIWEVEKVLLKIEISYYTGF